MKKTIRINFSDFWSGFDKTNNYFYNLLCDKYSIEIADEPDFLIYSTFGRDYLNYDCVKIFYTGENVRPDFNQCDYGIGFDYLTFEDRYFRYPIFMLYKKSWQKALDKHNFTKEDLQNKTGFCNFIYSNPCTQTCRDEFFAKLSEYKQVESGGRYLNNIGGPVDDKVMWQSKYKFSIAFENSIQSGYQTEKLIEAYAAKTIPIYMGNPNVHKEINVNSLIVCKSIDDFDNVIKKVIEIDQNDDLYLEMMQTPMLISQQEYEKVCSEEKLMEFLCEIFEQGADKAIRKNNYNFGTFVERDLKIAERAKKHKKISKMFGILD